MSDQPERLSVLLTGGGPGEGMILSLTELPMDLYVQQNVGSSPFYLRGEVRVAAQVRMPYHQYRRSLNDEPVDDGYCHYRYLGINDEPKPDGSGWRPSSRRR
jgi:hypothetical protein